MDYENVLHDLNLFADYPRLVGQGWSLTEELRFSFLLPLLLPLSLRTTGGFLVTLLFAVTCGAISQFVLFFGMGILITKHWETIPEILRCVCGWKRTALLAGAVGLFSISRWLPRYFPNASHQLFQILRPEYLVVAGVVLLLVLPLVSLPLRRFLESDLVRYLGRVSFSLYLVHLAVLLFGSPWAVVQLNALGLTGPVQVTVVVTLCVLAVSCATASVFYWAVESPCTRGFCTDLSNEALAEVVVVEPWNKRQSRVKLDFCNQLAISNLLSGFGGKGEMVNPEL